IRINIVGRRDRLSPELVRAIEQSERRTAHCTGLHLRIAVDYSAQHSIVEAARRAAFEPGIDPRRFQELLDEVDHSGPSAGLVDL
ncbi:undecaprenyl diphosphate synthase family protein, partial [Acinetobacter baumannii]